MTRKVMALVVAVTMSVLPTSRASAEPISPPNASLPACITLVGSNGSTASPAGRFEVIMRDLANNPIPNAHIVVDLANAPDLHLCAQQLANGVVADCPNNRASAITDANGRAVFTLMGSALAGPGSGLHNGRIYADGVLLGSPTVSAFDLDGVSGVGANDFSLWFGDFVAGATFGRADYDCSGAIGANDLSIWLGEFGSAASALSCAASCP